MMADDNGHTLNEGQGQSLPDPSPDQPPKQRSKLFTYVLVYLMLSVVVLLGWLYYRTIPKTAAEQYVKAEKLEKELASGGKKMKPEARKKFRKRVLESFEKVFDKFPDKDRKHGPKAHRKLAKLHEEVGEHKQAIEWYRKCAKRYPKDLGAPDDLHQAAELADKELKDYSAARELYAELAKAYPKDKRASSSSFRSAQLLDKKISKRKDSEVIDAYLDVVKRFPKSPEAPQALFRAAQLHEKLKAWKKAIALYKRIEAEYPKSSWAPKALRRWAPRSSQCTPF